tara:strand:- start:1691 stop:2041 length:351 start_codon:yes stop_codon:yes gene_type:complete
MEIMVALAEILLPVITVVVVGAQVLLVLDHLAVAAQVLVEQVLPIQSLELKPITLVAVAQEVDIVMLVLVALEVEETAVQVRLIMQLQEQQIRVAVAAVETIPHPTVWEKQVALVS